mmetsp:Transcript_2747/g.9208  ORF Transcript_2747/g.9208 Transcript_2747/m.9208 type:complete len:221 (-) Transcript_2747:918-1580(-)
MSCCSNELQDPLSREQESVILVTFRGTYSWIDVMHDLVCLPVTQKHGIPVHCGFNAAISKCSTAIFESLQACAKSTNVKRVVFTGHSYGGGCAMVLALRSLLDTEWRDMLWNSRIDLQIVVFGAPLVFGDPCTEEGMKILETLSNRLRCYVHQCDVVPRLLGRQSSALLRLLSENQSWTLSQTESSYSQHGEDRRKKWISIASNLAAGIVDAYKPHGKFL